MDTATDTAPPMGHNNPPEPTPLEQAKEEISLLTEEAEAWAGTPIENEQQAADVAKLLDTARKAIKRFEGFRKEEKEPHLAAGRAVDEAWKPVIADGERIVECTKQAQTAWLKKLDAEKRAAEEAARKEAEAKIAEAQRLAAEADGSVEAAKARDEAIEEAKRAERAAARASHDKAGAKAEGMTRSVGLRTVYSAKVVDRRLLLNHIATVDPAALITFVEEWATKQVRAGARGGIPGVEVLEDRVAA